MSVALIVEVWDTPFVGVPLITPVDVFNVIPGGNDPETKLYTIPPFTSGSVAESVVEYAIDLENDGNVVDVFHVGPVPDVIELEEICTFDEDGLVTPGFITVIV